MLTSLRHEEVNKHGVIEGNVGLRADLQSTGHLSACLYMDSDGPLEKEALMMQGKGRDLAVVKACSAVLTHLPAGSPQVTDQSVKAFAEHCPELQYVGFMGCSVTSKGVIHLTKVGSTATSPWCFRAAFIPMPSRCSAYLNEDCSDHCRSVSSVW